jgi:hypothetical protein
MNPRKLTTAGVILALSIFSSARCFAQTQGNIPQLATNEGKLIIYLFGSEKTGDKLRKLEKTADDAAEQQRLWDEHYGNNKPHVPTAADLAEQKQEAERKRQADLASEEKKKELAAQGLFKNPTDDDLKKWRDEHPMAPDQGKKATWEFIDNVTGNNGAGSDTSSNNGRDNARDGAWEAAKAAASDVRGSVKSTIDGMRNCKDGH